jgi:hypothetical protein
MQYTINALSMKNTLLMLLLLSLINSCHKKKSSQGENFLGKVERVALEIEDDSDQLTFFDNPEKPLRVSFENLPVGSNRPEGWMLGMMVNDLEKGMVGTG